MLYRDADYFLAVMKFGSVSKAAESLYISQPSLSQYLCRLEERVGVSLFDRTRTPWMLTPAGQCYAEYVDEYKQIQSHFEENLDLVKNGNIVKQTLSVGIPPWKGAVILPSVLSRFADKYPNVSVVVYEESGDKIRELLRQNVISVGIMNTPYYDKHIVYEKLLEERILLAVAKTHSLAKDVLTSLEKPSFFDIKSLHKQRLIIPGPDLVIAKEVQYFLASHAIKPAHVFFINNILTCLNLAAMGYGFTFVPEIGVQQCCYFDKLAFFSLSQPDLTWSFSVVYQDRGALSSAAKAFIDITKEQFLSHAR